MRRIEVFTEDEAEVALELIDDAIINPPGNDYEAIVAVEVDEQGQEQLRGYACFGPTPMTTHTFDLYWVAVDQDQQGKGIGATLVRAVEQSLAARGAKILRVETSSQEAYGKTLAFYKRINYDDGGRIPDFYKDGDDLIILYRRLSA